MHISEGTTFNLFGGTIQNGKAAADANVRVRGIFNMYGGTIQNGTASGSGGNVGLFAYSSSFRNQAFSMYGGTISGGTAGSYGGNIRIYAHAAAGSAYDNTAKFFFSGGLITGGQANNGGNIAFYGASAKTNSVAYAGYAQGEISGGVIENGTANAEGGNIYLRGYKGKVNDLFTDYVVMTNGTIRNGVAGTNGGNVAIGYSSQPSMFKMSGGQVLDGIANGGYGGNISVNLWSVFLLEDGLVSGGTVNSTENGNPVYKKDNKDDPNRNKNGTDTSTNV